LYRSHDWESTPEKVMAATLSRFYATSAQSP
jgi:hypothetical protein